MARVGPIISFRPITSAKNRGKFEPLCKGSKKKVLYTFKIDSSQLLFTYHTNSEYVMLIWGSNGYVLDWIC
jgi:hypothetical protein